MRATRHSGETVISWNVLMKGYMRTAATLCFALVVGLLMPQQAQGDSWGVSHSCSKPWDRNDEWSVDSYKTCIEDFVDEQKDAIKRHSDAAEEAIDDWNRFARGW